MIKTKICGITNLEDAQLACRLGADALGFIFAPSPRQVNSKTVCGITSQIPPFITRVGVFVNESPELINEIAINCGLDAIQLHGDESPEYCKLIRHRVVKVLRIKDRSDLDAIQQYENYVSAFLFDTYSPDQYGGTGNTFNWELLKDFITEKPFIISGGITPDNLASLLGSITPYGVDIGSGVELKPGRKDPDKLKQLFAIIKWV
ncbi:MAG: phosphoribosylanthranilate isomerase [Candidatus Margulisiibacteriota bacterium]